MSTAMNFSSKSFTPRPPDKGAFPLDHFGASAACRQSALAYLQCRMDRRVQLMANEPLEKLGFKDLINEKSEEKPKK
ncbi:COX19 protein, partial [Rhodinocichla rosea]|nr:COX19 protein [Rhodinocichla rosea]